MSPHRWIRYHTLLLMSMWIPVRLLAQPYELLLQGGHVIDPANNIDAVMDVAVAAGKVARVAANIPASEARKVVDVKGRYVTPGLVDLHTHVYIKGRASTVTPDDAVLPNGTTTIVDAGVAGARNFDDFKATIIDRAKTRVLAMVNIVASGMNDDQRKEFVVEDMIPQLAADKAKQYPAIVVGIKTAHFGPPGWIAVERAVEAGRLANLPVMLDSSVYSNSGRSTRDKVLDKMRPGDIHTHTYNDHQLELVSRFTGKVQPYMRQARQRGVIFDAGHGGGSFLWPVAKAAMADGFPPDTLGTDLHPGSILTLDVSVPNVMSKVMNLGMPLNDAVLRSTVNPAKAIRRFPEIGTLGVGKEADIAVLDLRQGVFAFVDSMHKKLTGAKKVECAMTIRAGKIVFDRDGASFDAAGNTPRVAAIAPFSAAADTSAEPDAVYDLVLRNGMVIDPANRRRGRFDIGIVGRQIRKIAGHIPAAQGRLVVDLTDYYVAPGLIDARASVNVIDNPATAVVADHHSLRSGATAVVDPKATPAVVKRSRVRVLAESRTFPAEALASGLTQESALEGASLSRTMTLLLNEGVSFDEIIDRGTRMPADALGRKDLGRFTEGGAADIAVFEIAQGSFPVAGPGRKRFAAKAKVECVIAIRDGGVAWDARGLSYREWSQAGAYTGYK